MAAGTTDDAHFDDDYGYSDDNSGSSSESNSDSDDQRNMDTSLEASPQSSENPASPDKMGGHDCQFVSEVPDTLMCLICTYASRDAQQIECCGKLFCRSCLSKLKGTEQRACPNCRKEEWKSFSDKKSERDIQSLKVKCSNHTNGCVWQGDLRDLEKHVTQCNTELVQCKYTSVGCKAKVLKFNAASHEESCTTERVNLLEGHLKVVEEKVRSPPPCIPPVVMKMARFAHHKSNKVLWRSQPFLSHPSGYKLCLQVNCFGIDKPGDHSESVSVMVSLMHGEHDGDLVWPFRGVVSFEILNQVADSRHATRVEFTERKECERNRRVSAAQGVSADGQRDRMLYSDKDFSNFMQNDSMYFRVTLVDVLASNKPWLL